MTKSTRRKFLQTSGVLLGTAFTGNLFAGAKSKPLLSFSTLACPDWNFTKIADFAVQHGYEGLELRGLQRQMDLPKCNEFNSPQNIEATLKLMKEKGLTFVNLGSSATLHFAEGAEREKNLADGRRFIDLAQQINCPYIRVYPNNFQKDQEKSVTMELIAKGLLALGDYAKQKNVIVLMETHGDLVKIDDLENLMQSAAHTNVGLVWDASNMWTATKESPVAAYQRLRKYIHHAHVKDAVLVEGKPQYTFLGKGEVPIFEAIDTLANGGYKGYYSFEWEKLWHPELADPEIALADYPIAMKKHFG